MPLWESRGARRELGRRPSGGEHFNVYGPLFGQAGRDADVQHSQTPRVFRAGEAEQAGFRVAESEGGVEARAGGVNLASVGVEAGGQVEGEEQRWPFDKLRVTWFGTEALQCEHGVADRAAQGAGASRTEDGVYDQTGAAEEALEGVTIGGDEDLDAILTGEVELGVVIGALDEEAADDFGSPAAEVAGYHEAVSAVVAGADEYDDAGTRCAAEFVAGSLGGGEAGVFHEGVEGDSGAVSGLLDGGHMGGGYYFHNIGQEAFSDLLANTASIISEDTPLRSSSFRIRFRSFSNISSFFASRIALALSNIFLPQSNRAASGIMKAQYRFTAAFSNHWYSQ